MGAIVNESFSFNDPLIVSSYEVSNASLASICNEIRSVKIESARLEETVVARFKLFSNLVSPGRRSSEQHRFAQKPDFRSPMSDHVLIARLD